MRKSIRMSAWLGALLAGAILFTSGGADAHEYFVGKNIPLPTRQDGKRFIQVSVGETVTLTVANAPMQTCSANIAAVQSSSIIRISSPQAPGPVQTREFKITGEMVGDTEIDITVQGVDPCTEDSHNPIVVQVLPDEKAILRGFGIAAGSEGRMAKGDLKVGLSALRGYSMEVLDGFEGGTLAPEVAAEALRDGWSQTWALGWHVARERLSNLSDYGRSQLAADDWPECATPFRFGAGTHGSFDGLRTSLFANLDGFRSKLEKQVASDMAGYSKIGAQLGIRYTPSYTLSRYPDIDVRGPANGASPADPGPPLYLGYKGGLSWSTEFLAGSCAAFGGLADPAKGPVRIDLFDGTGLVESKVAPIQVPGFWDVMFDELVAGKIYRAHVEYDGGDLGHDTGEVFVPQNFRF